MNILFISEYFTPYDRGGAEISTSLIIKHAAKYYNCYILTEKYQRKPWKFDRSVVYPVLRRIHMGQKSFINILRYGINIIIAPAMNIIRIVNFIKRYKIDIIHFVPTAYYYASLVIAAILTKKPFVIDIRGLSLICPVAFSSKYCMDNNYTRHNYNCLRTSYDVDNKILKIASSVFALYEYMVFYLQVKIFKVALKLTGKYKIIPNSKFIRKMLIKNGYPEKKIQVIYNIINAIPERGKRYTRKNRIVYAGQLEKFKGIWDIILAFNLLNNSKLSLLIAGDGREMDRLTSYIEENKISNIIFLGRLPNEKVHNLYRESKIIVSPSNSPESFGRFILESFAARTPLITTNVGGNPEGIKDRETGILVKPNDHIGLARAIKELLNNDKLYEHITDNLKKEVSKYSTEAIGPQRLKLYESLVGYYPEINQAD